MNLCVLDIHGTCSTERHRFFLSTQGPNRTGANIAQRRIQHGRGFRGTHGQGFFHGFIVDLVHFFHLYVANENHKSNNQSCSGNAPSRNGFVQKEQFENVRPHNLGTGDQCSLYNNKGREKRSIERRLMIIGWRQKTRTSVSNSYKRPHKSIEETFWDCRVYPVDD